MIRRGKDRSRYARRPRNMAFIGFVWTLPCTVRVEAPDPARAPSACWGRIEADHMGERALGRKAEDDTCVPICEQHHRERTDHSGSFRHLTRDQLRPWRARAIARTQAAWSAR